MRNFATGNRHLVLVVSYGRTRSWAALKVRHPTRRTYRTQVQILHRGVTIWSVFRPDVVPTEKTIGTWCRRYGVGI